MPFAARQGYFSAVVAEANARRVGTSSTNASLSWTANSTVTSTTQFKFGTASQQVTTDNSEIESANTDLLDMGTGDLTVEFWIYIDSLSNHGQSCDVFSKNVNFGFGARLAQSFNTNGLSSANPNRLNIFARQQADLDYWTLPTNWPIDQWNFVVIQRKSGSFAAWLNGTLLSKSNASSSYSFGTTSGPVLIGTADGGNGVGPTSGTDYVWIDEFCISNTYRYDSQTENIPVPTAAFTLDSYTTQLLHMDGSNGGTTFTNETS
jgi:Concanavalin A-like lectin/glucanases superfamily